MNNHSVLIEKINSIGDAELNKIAGAFSSRKALHIYADQIMCFTALVGMAFWRNGPRALCLVLVSIIVSVLVDFLCCKMCAKVYSYRDLSNIAAGMCIALMTPATASYVMVGAGAALAIGIKHIFGGKDNYIFNPTAVTLAFLIICYPAAMLYYPSVGEWLPAFGETSAPLATGVESLLVKLGLVQDLSFSDIMLGNFVGAMGTTHIAVILVCALCLAFRRSISVIMTATAAAVIFIIAILFPIYDNTGTPFDFASTLGVEFVGGYMLFGLVFLANDPQTLPKTQLGKVYYAVTLGIFAVIFRRYGKVEGSFVFALLAANAMSLKIDSISRSHVETFYRLTAYVKRNLSTYERFRESAKVTRVFDLEATREIQIEPTNYYMPPIDGKVTKINRKKPNLLKKVIEKVGELTGAGNIAEISPKTATLNHEPNSQTNAADITLDISSTNDEPAQQNAIEELKKSAKILMSSIIENKNNLMKTISAERAKKIATLEPGGPPVADGEPPVADGEPMVADGEPTTEKTDSEEKGE
ncbi:MAG: RnfABCDGE type electron transport complex subunit D [Oscillospiraceae bacterium]|nr:RnfABCDGE type electron transport complex subunit D [Oscillospiraceae bacterium]